MYYTILWAPFFCSFIINPSFKPFYIIIIIITLIKGKHIKWKIENVE